MAIPPLHMRKIKAALHKIAARADGLLTPEAVVETAKDKHSPLHSHFEWDDGHAASLYRLEQARRIIRLAVEVVTPPNGGDPITIRSFVSLPSKRGRSDDADDAPGYVAVTDAIRKVSWRNEMLDMMREDARRFIEKYATMSEAAGIITEIRAVLKRLR
jgi:hypothetical protein